MGNKHGCPTLGYNDTVAAVTASLEDGAVPMVIGPPGVGKTALMNQIAERLGLRPVQLISREYESFELSGVLDVRNGELSRHVIGPARLMCEEPCLGMFDEATASAAPIFAQVSKILHERKFGDRHVHPRTKLMAAANPQEQSLDSASMPLPLINRLRIFFMQPTITEVQDYFSKLGPSGSALRVAGQELANVLDAKPDLVQIEPAKPEECMNDNTNWPSPRAWERAVTTLARVGTLPNNVFKACLTGDLGPHTADAFLAIRNTYGSLPSVAEIVNNPGKAKLPKDFLTGVGLLSMLPSVCQIDPCAAWVYACRVNEKTFSGGQETRIALASSLGRVAHMSTEAFQKSQHAEAARKARVDLMAEQNRTRGKV